MARGKTAGELAREVDIAPVRQSATVEQYYRTAEHVLLTARARGAARRGARVGAAGAALGRARRGAARRQRGA